METNRFRSVVVVAYLASTRAPKRHFLLASEAGDLRGEALEEARNEAKVEQGKPRSMGQALDLSGYGLPPGRVGLPVAVGNPHLVVPLRPQDEVDVDAFFALLYFSHFKIRI